MTAFIYALIDPRNSECRYVGKTCDPRSRMYSHTSDFRSRTWKSMWVRSLQKQGVAPEFCVLEVVPKNDWVDSERFWIAYFRFLGARLTNATHGGEGGDFTPEIRTKLSQKAIAQWADPSKRPARNTLSPERRAQQSAVTRKLLSDPARFAARLEQLNSVRHNPSRLENLVTALQKPEVKARLRVSMDAWRKANPEKVRLQAAAMHTASAKANSSAAVKREDVRKKMSESAKKRWRQDSGAIIEAQNRGKQRYAAEHKEELQQRVKHTRTPQALEAHAIAMKCEDVRKKMSESAKKRWQRDRDAIIETQNAGKRSQKSSNPSKDGKSPKE